MSSKLHGRQKLQTPSSKHQRNPKSQAPEAHQRRVCSALQSACACPSQPQAHRLELEVWSFSGVWCLVFFQTFAHSEFGVSLPSRNSITLPIRFARSSAWVTTINVTPSSLFNWTSR